MILWVSLATSYVKYMEMRGPMYASTRLPSIMYNMPLQEVSCCKKETWNEPNHKYMVYTYTEDVFTENP